MVERSFNTQVRYVTDAAGAPTDVLVPFALWEQMLATLNDSASGLAWIDEHEPKAQILADLKSSLQQAAQGETFPISDLWTDIEEIEQN